MSEGLANFAASRLRTVSMLAIMVLAIGGTAVSEAITIDRIVEDQQRYIAAGGNIILARGDIDVAACLDLTHLEHVIAAAAVRREPESLKLGLPGERAALVTATASVAGLVPLASGQWPVADELIATADAAGERDLTMGRNIAVDGRTITISGVGQTSRLGADFSSGLVAFGPPTITYDTCIIETTTNATEVFERILEGLVARPGATLDTQRRVPQAEFGVDHPADYRERPTRLTWIPAGLAISLFWTVILTARRSERGLYASVGASTSTTTLIYLAEFTAALAVSVVLAGAAAVFFAQVASTSLNASDFLHYGVGPGAKVVAMAAGASLVVTAVAPRKPISELVKDR